MKVLRVSGLIVAVCALAIAIVSSVSLLAQPGQRGGHFGRGGFGAPGGRMGLPLGQLELTDAQRTQVKSVFDQRRADLAAVGQRLRAAHEAQRQAVTRIPVDENEIRAKVTDAANIEAEAAILHARIHEAVFQLLTPEQQAKAQSLQADRQKRIAERQERRKQRMQERRGSRPQAQPQQ